jgi:MFS family permease
MTSFAETAPLPADTGGTRLATRLSFFAAGFVMACWAPMVPFAKANVGADEGQIGLLLLCLGLGSILAMPVTGWISAQVGSKPMILTGGLGLVLILPFLSVVSSPLLLGAALLLFGASLGTIDVAMNVHATEVEKAAGRPLMSGFHGMFSVGGFVGAGDTTLLLSQDVSPLAGNLHCRCEACRSRGSSNEAAWSPPPRACRRERGPRTRNRGPQCRAKPCKHWISGEQR